LAAGADRVDANLSARAYAAGYRELIVLGPEEEPIGEPPAPTVSTLLHAHRRATVALVAQQRHPEQGDLPRLKQTEADLLEALTEYLGLLPPQDVLHDPLPMRARNPAAAWQDRALLGMRIAVSLGTAVDLDVAERLSLAHGMLLRDLGEFFLPATLRTPARALTEPERKGLERHSALGYQLLAGLRWGSGATRMVVLQHHERLDGSGYPGRLVGTEPTKAVGERFNLDHMVPMAQVAALADVFSGLVSDRPHRAALPPSEALAALRQAAGTQFHAVLVDHLAAIWQPPRRESASPAVAA
jgi:response regulator RpfG family c-di-GMP phosphodiesterase